MIQVTIGNITIIGKNESDLQSKVDTVMSMYEENISALTESGFVIDFSEEVTIPIELPNKLYGKVKKYAKRDGVTIEQWITQAVRVWLDK